MIILYVVRFLTYWYFTAVFLAIIGIITLPAWTWPNIAGVLQTAAVLSAGVTLIVTIIKITHRGRA